MNITLFCCYFFSQKKREKERFLFLFPWDYVHFDEERYFCCQPRREAQDEGVDDTELGDFLRPERLEVRAQAYFAAVVHLGGLSVQLGKDDLEGSLRVSCRDLY